MSNPGFRRDPGHSAAWESLSPRQQIAYKLLAVGGILPILFLWIIPVFWMAALQMACLAGLAFMRWRSPLFRGSVAVMLLAALASAVSVVAAITA